MLTPLAADDPRQVGPYRLQNRLGAGGMGTVYLGFDRDGRAVAVKVLAVELSEDAELRARFRDEVAAARLVQGSRVAEVLDADAGAARPWLATEYVDGLSLFEAVRDRGKLTGSVLAGLAAGLAEALAAIHAAGVVHRDLKPANILLAWDGPKLIDFGIAQSTDSTSRTRTGQLIGTLAWMSPEQLRGERAGPPSDVFAWGACVTYAATGRLPFGGPHAEAVAVQVLTGAPDLSGVPDELLPIIRDALAREIAGRPAASDLVARLAGQQARDLVPGPEAGTTSVPDWLTVAGRATPGTGSPGTGSQGTGSQETGVPGTGSRGPGVPGPGAPGPGAPGAGHSGTWLLAGVADAARTELPSAGGQVRRRSWRLAGVAALTALIVGTAVAGTWWLASGNVDTAAGVSATASDSSLAAGTGAGASPAPTTPAPTTPAPGTSPSPVPTADMSVSTTGDRGTTGGSVDAIADPPAQPDEEQPDEDQPDELPPGLASALDFMEARGYPAIDTVLWDESRTLNTLIGASTADYYKKLAFFFVDGQAWGTDTNGDPSAEVSLWSYDDTHAVLEYRLYDPSDGLCCPSGGSVYVTFVWTGSEVVREEGTLPPSDPAVPGSRR